MSFSKKYLEECIEICNTINSDEIEQMADLINSVRLNNGRIFFLGVGGGAGHASHAVNDFRKICNIESYAPTDNVSELTARVNDDGWDTSYVNWLRGSHLSDKDLLFVFSVPLIVYNRDEFPWSLSTNRLSSQHQPSDPGDVVKDSIASEEWEEATIEDLESGSYEPA